MAGAGRSTCSTSASAWVRSPRHSSSAGSSTPGMAWQTVILGSRARGRPARGRVRRRPPAIRPPRARTRDERRPDGPGPPADPAGGRDRLLRRVRDRRQQLAGALPRGGVADPGHLGAGPVLGMPRARAPRQRAARRPVRPRLVRGRQRDRCGGCTGRRGRGAVAARLDRAVRRRGLRVRTGLPADRRRRRRPLPGPVRGGHRVPVRHRRHRRDRLSAAHGFRLGRGGTRGGDARRRGARPRLRSRPGGGRTPTGRGRHGGRRP